MRGTMASLEERLDPVAVHPDPPLDDRERRPAEETEPLVRGGIRGRAPGRDEAAAEPGLPRPDQGPPRPGRVGVRRGGERPFAASAARTVAFWNPTGDFAGFTGACAPCPPRPAARGRRLRPRAGRVGRRPRRRAGGALPPRADTWARVVRIDNSRPRDVLRRGPYPKVVYALVFELSGILWFYTDVDGTQSLSLTRNTVDARPGRSRPALPGHRPGLPPMGLGGRRRGWSGARRPQAPQCLLRGKRGGAAASRMAAGGAAQAPPMLLSYYVDTPGGPPRPHGPPFRRHAPWPVGASIADESDRPRSCFPAHLGADARALSAYLRGGPVAAARTFPDPVRPASYPSGSLAAAAGQPGPRGVSPRTSAHPPGHPLIKVWCNF